MATKITKKEMFSIIAKQFEPLMDETFDRDVEGVEPVTGKAILEFLVREIRLLEKKKSSSKPSAKQIENEGIKEKILEVLSETGERMTISQMLKDERLSSYSNQKINALLTQLKASGQVQNEHEKKVSYFFV